jgi:hypothetical protein
LAVLAEEQRPTTGTRAGDAAFEHSPLYVLDGSEELRRPARLKRLQDEIFAGVQLDTGDTPGR